VTRIRFTLLLGITTFAATVPLMAVITHKRDRGQSEPNFATAVPTLQHSLILYNPDGYRVAWCDQADANHALMNCRVADGYDLNDVMNAWLKAYEDR
jgi:hypothetical protein